LLVVVTICCAVLGFRQGYIVPYVRQEAAVQRIIEAGGAINYAPAKPAWLAPVVGRDIYHRAIWVDLEHRHVDDDLLTAFHDMPYVTNLYLAANPITDDGLRHVVRLQKLERLSLWRTGITDEGLKRLVGMKQLTGLDLHITAVSDDGLSRLTNLTSLGEITLPSRITDDGLAHLGRLPDLRVVKANNARCITPRGFRHLAGCPVHLIEADWMEPLHGKELEHFAQLPHLLSLPGEVVDCSDEQLQYLAGMRQLRELSISGADLTDAGLVHLGSLKKLARLQVTGRISATGLDSIRRLPQLRRLHVTTELIGEEDIPQLLAGWGPQFDELVVNSPWFDPSPKWHLRPGVDSTPLAGWTKQRLIALGNGRGRLRIFASACHGKTPLDADGNVENLYLTLSVAARSEDLRRLARWPRLRHLGIESASDEPLTLDHVAACRELKCLNMFGCQIEPSELGKLRDLDQLVTLKLQLGWNDESLTQQLVQLKQLKGLELSVPHLPPSLNQTLRLKDGLPGTKIRLNRHPSRSTSFPQGTVTHLQLTGPAIPDLDELSGLGPVKILTLSGAERLHDLSGLDRLDALQELRLTTTVFATPKQWEHVGRREGLSKLILSGSNVTDDALRQVGRLSNLLDLQLDDTPVTDRGIAHLDGLSNLLSLQLNRLDPQGGPWISDNAMPTIRGLTSLVQLQLFRTDVTDAGVQHLASLKRLKHLNLSGTKVTNEGLQHLTALDSLQTLDLAYCEIDDDCLETLTKFQSLRQVNCHQTGVTRPAVNKLRLRHSHLGIRR
jgi:Leucine-rich repeat (LRR) protein